MLEKKIIKQVLNRWFFVGTKAILGTERTGSDSGSHMHCLC